MSKPPTHQQLIRAIQTAFETRTAQRCPQTPDVACPDPTACRQHGCTHKHQPQRDYRKP